MAKPVPARLSADLARLRHVVPHPAVDYSTDDALRASCGGRAHELAAVATVDIVGTVIRAGDFVLWLHGGGGNPLPRDLRACRTIRVPRDQLATVARYFDALRVIETSRRPFGCNVAAWARHSLGKPQRGHWSDGSSPLVVVSPLVEIVSAPIVAASNEAALFVLLGQVGCRLPE